MTRVRLPAAAGTFYPSDPEELARTVDRLIAEAKPPEDVRDPIGLIVPHAGFVYSGPIAATGYATLEGGAMHRVMVLGPSHFVPLLGAAVSETEVWRTPLGDVPVDEELREVAVKGGAAVDKEPHAMEHALETQLPFLQRVIGRDMSVLPMAVGEGWRAETADLIDELRGAKPRVLVVVSTDLSHYHDAETARKLDRRTAEYVVARDSSAIGPEDACGVHALRGAVEWARRGDLEVRLLDLRTSADTAGDPRSVVGYGAWAIKERT